MQKEQSQRMVNLNDDQKVELDSALIRLVGQGVITTEQRDKIMEAVLGIVLTPEQEDYERRATTPRQEKPGAAA
jgi:hypothetical protein